MQTRFKIEGILELIEEFQNATPEMRAAATARLVPRAQHTHDTIRAAYPSRTGNLRKGMTIVYEDTQFAIAAIIRNRAPHAYIYEHGTVARHTDIGADRGSMPAGNVFIPRMIAARRAWFEDLKRILEEFGFEASGSEEAA